MSDVPTPELATSIISEEAADLLKRAGEGTLGKLNSNENVTTLASQREAASSHAVKCVDNVDKADGVVETDTKIVENSIAVDGNLSMEKSETVADESVGAKSMDYKNNNTNTKDTEVELAISSIEVDTCISAKDVKFEESCGTGVVVVERRESEKDGSVSESDDGDEFYESRSEVLPQEMEVCETYQGKGEQDEALGLTEEVEGIKFSREKEDSPEEIVKTVESDVAYHSESVGGDLFQELEKESLVDSSNVLNNMPSNTVDIGVNHETKLTEEVKADSSESIVETGSSNKVADDKSSGSKDDNNLGDSVDTIIGADNVSNVVAGAIAEDMKATGALDKENVIIRTNVEGFIPETDVCTSLTQNDEVFMTLPVGEMGLDQNMIEFAKDYVTHVVMKSTDIYNKQLKDEKILVRKQSYTLENIDISVSKRHFSEELMDTASNIIPRKLSSGSVEILSPIVHIPSNDNCDLKFFTCKVETDVVLTSIEEEKNPLDGLVRMDSLPSPITGFGICYSSLKGHSDLDSDSDDGSGDACSGDIGTESSLSVLDPEFMAMPVVRDKIESELEHKDNQDISTTEETMSAQNISNNAEKGMEQDENISQKDSAVQQNVNIEQTANICDDGETEVNVVEGITVSPDKCSEVVENIGEILEKSLVRQIAVDDQDSDNEVRVGTSKVNQMQIADNSIDLEERDQLRAEIKDDGSEGDENLAKASKGIIDEENNGKHVEDSSRDVDSTLVCSVDVSNDEDTKGASGDDTEAGSRLSRELSPLQDGTQDIDAGTMGRKKSKKKGSKKGSKEECLVS